MSGHGDSPEKSWPQLQALASTCKEQATQNRIVAANKSAGHTMAPSATLFSDRESDNHTLTSEEEPTCNAENLNASQPRPSCLVPSEVPPVFTVLQSMVEVEKPSSSADLRPPRLSSRDCLLQPSSTLLPNAEKEKDIFIAVIDAQDPTDTGFGNQALTESSLLSYTFSLPSESEDGFDNSDNVLTGPVVDVDAIYSRISALRKENKKLELRIGKLKTSCCTVQEQTQHTHVMLAALQERRQKLDSWANNGDANSFLSREQMVYLCLLREELERGRLRKSAQHYYGGNLKRRHEDEDTDAYIFKRYKTVQELDAKRQPQGDYEVEDETSARFEDKESTIASQGNHLRWDRVVSVFEYPHEYPLVSEDKRKSIEKSKSKKDSMTALRKRDEKGEYRRIRLDMETPGIFQINLDVCS